MGKNLSYIQECRAFSISKYVMITFLALCYNMVFGNCSDVYATKYISDEFGYINVDEAWKYMAIFKKISSEDVFENIACCRINDKTDGYFTISSLQPMSYRDIDIHILKEYSQSPDSISVRIKLSPLETESLYVKVYPSIGCQEIFSFSPDGTVEFRLKKHQFKYDNFFSVVIYPEINPFRIASSWGNCETLSFFDLRLDEILDVADSELSRIEIEITDFKSDIFQKWVIIEDFVLMKDSYILWRNIQFENSKLRE